MWERTQSKLVPTVVQALNFNHVSPREQKRNLCAWNYYYSYSQWSIFRGNLNFSCIYCKNTCILSRSLAFQQGLLLNRNKVKVKLCHLRGKRTLQNFVILTNSSILTERDLSHMLLKGPKHEIFGFGFFT